MPTLALMITEPATPEGEPDGPPCDRVVLPRPDYLRYRHIPKDGRGSDFQFLGRQCSHTLLF